MSAPRPLLVLLSILSVSSGCARGQSIGRDRTLEKLLTTSAPYAGDLYTSYRAQDPTGLNVVFQRVEGNRIIAGCSYVHDGQTQSPRCDWIQGKNALMVAFGGIPSSLTSGPANGRRSVVLHFTPENAGRRLLLSSIEEFVTKGGDKVVSIPWPVVPEWVSGTRGQVLFQRKSRVLLASGDELLIGKRLSREASSADDDASSAASAEPSTGGTRSAKERLEAVEELKKDGLVNQEEYERKRKEILESL